MKFVLKMTRVGLYSSAVFFIAEPLMAGTAVGLPPAIAIQNAIPNLNTPVTLQYKTNLSSPTWQTLGAFSGSTNIFLFNQPSAFFRGVYSNATCSATLAWPASTDSSVAGYMLYYGTASGAYTKSLDAGPATTATVSNLAAGTRYYFTTRTYNASGVVSPFSNETNAAFQARFTLNLSGLRQIRKLTQMMVTQTAATAVAIPLPVRVITKQVTATVSNPVTLQFTTNLSLPDWQPLGTFSSTTNISFTNLPAVFIRGYCTNLTTSATLAWQRSNDPVAGYLLYYGTTSHNYTGVVNAGASTRATVSNLVSGQTYYFAVTAYDSTGLESSPSVEASGVMQAKFSLAIGNP